MLKSFPKRKISKKKRRRLFLYWFIALILFVAFFANFVKIISAAISQFARKPQGERLTFSKFEGEKITGVILGSPLLLATFDPVNLKIDIFELPQNLYLEVGDRGFYLADRIQNLDSQAQGVQLLAATLMANFMLPVDFYLDFGKQKIDNNKISKISKRLTQPSSLLWFFQIPTKSSKILKTNLTLSDQYRLLWQLRKVRSDKFNYQKMDLSNFEELILPNYDKVLKVSADGLVPATASVFQDLSISQEGLTVEVKNAAGEAGLAQKVINICQNIGIKAVSAESSDEVLANTKILAKDGLVDSATVKRLAKTFGAGIENTTDDSFSDVVIFTGLDLAEQL